MLFYSIHFDCHVLANEEDKLLCSWNDLKCLETVNLELWQPFSCLYEMSFVLRLRCLAPRNPLGFRTRRGRITLIALARKQSQSQTNDRPPTTKLFIWHRAVLSSVLCWQTAADRFSIFRRPRSHWYYRLRPRSGWPMICSVSKRHQTNELCIRRNQRPHAISAAFFRLTKNTGVTFWNMGVCRRQSRLTPISFFVSMMGTDWSCLWLTWSV